MDAKIQISIDVIDLEEALALARASVKAGVDWLEVGTPLLLAEGLHAVRAFRSMPFPIRPSSSISRRWTEPGWKPR